jgi:hypothetical protein
MLTAGQARVLVVALAIVLSITVVSPTNGASDDIPFSIYLDTV